MHGLVRPLLPQHQRALSGNLALEVPGNKEPLFADVHLRNASPI